MKNLYGSLDRAGFAMFIVGLVSWVTEDLPALASTIEQQDESWIACGLIMSFIGFVMKNRA